MKSILYRKALKTKRPKIKILRKILLSFLLSSSLVNQTHSSVIFENIDSEIDNLSQKIISLPDVSNLPSNNQEIAIKPQQTQTNKRINVDKSELKNDLILKKEQSVERKRDYQQIEYEKNNFGKELKNTNQQTILKAKVKAYRIISREEPNVKSKQVEIYRENRILYIEDIITNDTGTKWAKLTNKNEYISAKWLEFDDEAKDEEENANQQIALQEQEQKQDVVKEIKEENTIKEAKITEKPLDNTYSNNFISANYDNKNLSPQETIKKSKNNDNNLSKEDQELSNNIMKTLQTAGAIYSSEDSESRKEIIKNMASSYLNSKANELVRNYIDSLNTSVNADFSFNYNERSGFSGNAKALFPILNQSDPKVSYFIQSGIGEFSNDRTIGHFGGGMRYYPNAVTTNDSGNMMFGLNLVYDHDFSREHKRMSVGAEAMIDTLAFNANVYHRLSNWIDSYDFDKDYVQERPASGWDAKIKYAFPSLVNVSVFAKMQQWYGEKVGVFGSSNVEDLERNPFIYEGGISYSPFPALTFTLSHSRSAESSKKNTSINANINIPLDEKAMKLAFQPKLAGIENTIEGSRTQFIDRDYSMVLEYRATPNKYHISYCGDLGNDKHCILLKNGFDEVVKNTPMRVTPTHSCVLFENGFDYITDNSGKVYIQISSSCTPNTDLNAVAGESSGKFPISIKKLSFEINANPEKIERYEESLVTLAGGALANNLKVIWKLIGKGELVKTNTSDLTDENGESTIRYQADPSMKDKEEVEIIASVNGVEFKAPVQVLIFGNDDNDLSIDKEVIGNKEIAIATYKNLRPNKTNVKWRLEGEDKALFLLEDENGNSSTVNELQLIADEKGESQVKIIGLENDGKVKIFAKNVNDDHVSEKSKELEVKNYKATMILPTHNHPITNAPFENGTIDYESEFVVKLTGLMPNTTVEWTAKDADSGKKIKINSSQQSTSNEKGESQVTFEAINDYNIKNLEISALYNQSVANKIEVKDIVKLHQYTLSIQSDKTELVGDETFKVTARGGKPNASVEWTLSGDGTIVSKSATFDNEGKAYLNGQGKSPFNNSINVEAKAFNQTLKASAKISVFQTRGILAHPTGNLNGGNGRTTLLGTNNGEDGQAFGSYSQGYSIFTLTNHNGNFDLGIYGYQNTNDVLNANIKVTYTPAYGGNQKWNLNYYINSKNYYLGNNFNPFDMKHYTYLLFSNEEALIPTKQNNGIYKFEDLNNKYIKPTYLHLKLP
ncbi:TPA: inverse autotransporter beta domain-containing protein [Campylobacter coli]|nr:inverse autotransporter beta domain-containing protein [Campylobacter coli]